MEHSEANQASLADTPVERSEYPFLRGKLELGSKSFRQPSRLASKKKPLPPQAAASYSPTSIATYNQLC